MTCPTVMQRAPATSARFIANRGKRPGQPAGGTLASRRASRVRARRRRTANLSPVHHAARPRAGEPLPGAELQSTRQPVQLRLSQLEPTNRLDMKMRFDWNITNNTKAYVRIAREKEDVEGARGVWWGASDVALPSPNLGTNRGRSVSGNIVTVLSPTMTNEALVSCSRLTLDNTYKDPSKMRLAGNGVRFDGSSRQSTSPYIPGVIPDWGGGVSNMWSVRQRHVRAQRRADVLATSSPRSRRARPEVRRVVGAAAEAAELQNNEEATWSSRPGWTPGRTGSRSATCWSAVRDRSARGTRSPHGEFRMWNVDVFAQDTWKLGRT